MEPEKLVFIADVIRATLEVISKDLLDRYNRWREESQPRLNLLPEFHVNYTAAFLSYSLLGMHAVKYAKEKDPNSLRAFRDHLKTCISAVRFFSKQFDRRQETRPAAKGGINSYGEVLERLEILAAELESRRVYAKGSEEVPTVTIGGFDFDREERRLTQYGVPATGSHRQWMDKFRAKYEVIGSDEGDISPVIHEFFAELLPAGIAESAEHILQMTADEQAAFWGRLSGIDKALTAQVQAALPLLEAFARYADAPKPEAAPQILNLLDAMESILASLRKKDEAELREELQSLPGRSFTASALAECNTVLSRTNVLLSRHRCLANIAKGIARIRAELPETKTPAVAATRRSKLNPRRHLEIIKRSNEEAAERIEADERKYAELAVTLRDIMREIAALLSPMNKATCIRNVRLIVRALARAQMENLPCAEKLAALFGDVQLWDPENKKIIPENLEKLLARIL